MVGGGDEEGIWWAPRCCRCCENPAKSRAVMPRTVRSVREHPDDDQSSKMMSV